jgi:hypothetical protein
VGRAFDPERFEARSRLDGQAVLLVDDTWTTGASAQSAAAALRRAGAGPVAAVVVGRHVNRSWGENDGRLRALESPFRWDRCALGERCLAGGLRLTGDEQSPNDPRRERAAVPRAASAGGMSAG